MVSRNNKLRSMKHNSINVDFSQLVELQERIQQLTEGDLDKYFRDVLEELGTRLMTRAVKRTPVDTGTLRRNWQLTKVMRFSDHYRIRVLNTTEYAHWVENGHRTRNRQGWVPGYFMLRKATYETEAEMMTVLERELKKFLEGKLGL